MHGTSGTNGTMRSESANSAKSARANFYKKDIALFALSAL